MIDTIRLVKEVSQLPFGFEKRLHEVMDQQQLTLKDLKSDKPVELYLGKIGGMTITFNRNKLTILGSLTTLVTGSNLKFADKAQIIEGIIGLEGLLEFSLKDARVTRLDVAGNIVTKNPILEYCKCLLDINKFNRYEQPTGVVFKNDTTYLQFYDKIEEMRSKRHSIDTAFIHHNILRYECKLYADVFKRLIKNRRPTLVQVLENYDLFVEEWRRLFQSINKRRDSLGFPPEIFTEKLEFDRALEIIGINTVGGLGSILKIIDEAKAKEYFTGHKDQATLLKKRMKTLMERPLLTKKTDLVSELELKINLIVNCCMDDAPGDGFKSFMGKI